MMYLYLILQNTQQQNCRRRRIYFGRSSLFTVYYIKIILKLKFSWVNIKKIRDKIGPFIICIHTLFEPLGIYLNQKLIFPSHNR